MKRILFDAHQIGRRQTGNETYVRELVPRLQVESDLELIAALERGARLGPGSRVRYVPRNGLARLAALSLLARRVEADLVHAIYFLPPALARPSVLTVHDISFEIHPEFFSRASLIRDRVLIRSSARAASTVITVSQTSRDEIISRYQLPAERVVAIPNGVGDEFAPSPDWTPYDGTRPLRVLAVGVLQPRKNLIRLVDALKLLGGGLDVALRVVGPSGFQAERIRNRLEGRRNLEVRISGWVAQADLVREYHEADVFVFPSIYEGFGLPVVEAMASGIPVVASTGGALPEIVGGAALLVDPFDVVGLAKAIERVAGDPSLASKLRAQGLERATHFSWTRSAAAHAGVYRDLLA